MKYGSDEETGNTSTFTYLGGMGSGGQGASRRGRRQSVMQRKVSGQRSRPSLDHQ